MELWSAGVAGSKAIPYVQISGTALWSCGAAPEDGRTPSIHSVISNCAFRRVVLQCGYETAES